MKLNTNKIDIDKLNKWWKGLSPFAKNELYKYWEGEE